MTTAVPLSVNNQHVTMLSVPHRTQLYTVTDRLHNYVTEMKPGRPVDPRHGGTLQMQLWATIKQVLKAKPDVFQMLYTELLLTIHQHRTTVFSERYAFRFFQELKLASPELRNFERTLNLLLATCNPATRRYTYQQVDIKTALQGFNDEALIERVLAYYAI